MNAKRPAHHAFPWRRVLGVALAMTLLVVVLWTAIRQVSDTEVVPEPTVPPPTSMATPAASPPAPQPTTPAGDGATPEANDEVVWPSGSLPAMLAMAPDQLADDSLPLNDIARYSDITGWMTAQGIGVPTAEDDPVTWEAWRTELEMLALPASLREFGLDPIWSQTYGFDLTQVHQVMVIGQAPDLVVLLRGAFTEDSLIPAWVASGYQPVELEGVTIWTLSPGGEIDLSAPESRPAMGVLNNLVVLPDGTLAAAARMDRLGSVLQVADGDVAPLAENPEVAPLLVPGRGVESLTSALLARGTLLQAPPGTEPDHATPVVPVVSMASPAAADRQELVTPAMGEVSVLLVGITVPVDDLVPFAMYLVMNEEEQVVPSVLMLQERLATMVSPVTGQSYAATLGEGEVTMAGNVILVAASQPPVGTDWLTMISDRDLAFAFWVPAG